MISSCFVHEALECVKQRGMPVEPLLTAAGLPFPVRGPVSAARYGALWLEIATTIDDEFFGQGARAMRSGSFTLLCHCVLHSGTLERALRRALRFLRGALDDPRGELIIEDGLAQIVLRDEGEARPAFAYRTYWIMLHGVASWLVGRHIPLRRVDFRCPAPAYNADYRLFFGAPVRFNAEVSRIAFDLSILSLPAIRSESDLKAFLRRAPANILVRYKHDEGLAAAIHDRLRHQPLAAWPGFEELARQMRMPASTLRRHLREEGQTYQAIKDEIRHHLATDWLLHSRRSVGEIAADLGFAEPSAFHRAFRKWTARSPGEFRREGVREGGLIPATEDATGSSARPRGAKHAKV